MRPMTPFITPRLALAKVEPGSEAVHDSSGARWLSGLALVGGLGGTIAVLMMIGLVLADLWGPRNPAVVFGFSRCGDAACFRGLIPGLTSWTEARAAFGNRLVHSFDVPDGEIRIYESAAGFLGRVRIQLPADGSLLIGHVIGLYGAPCGVTIYPQARKFRLRYPTARFVTPTNQFALDPHTSVVFVEFGDPAAMEQMGAQSCLAEQRSPEIGAVDREWHGFASLRHYLQNW